MVRYETSWQNRRLDDRIHWATGLLDLLYLEPRTRDLSPGCSMGVIRFWSDDTRQARDVFLIRRDYAEGTPTGRIKVLVPAPDELFDPWGPWGSWRTVDTDHEAFTAICHELDNLPTKQVEPVVWTLHDEDGVVARLVATRIYYPGLVGQLEPTGRFDRWCHHFAVETLAANMPGLTMFDHAGARVPSYGIRVDADSAYWFSAGKDGRPV